MKYYIHTSIKLSVLILSSAILLLGEKKPNLIVIMTDDQGYHDVGFNGSKEIPTPYIDSIAENGVKFTDGYVSFPVCGPSRAGFITGRYQDRFGFTTNPTQDPNNETAGLPLTEDTMADVLKKVGYKSAIVGKWHLGTHPKFHPLKRGFDYFYGFLSGGHNYMPEMLTVEDITKVSKRWQWYSTKLRENHKAVELEKYLTEALTDAAIDFIDQHKKENNSPFMLFLSYNAPHTPFQATKKYLDRFENVENWGRKRYCAMISAVDDGVGKVLEKLENENIKDNTIIFFLSDNGGPVKHASNNFPLRGAKGDLYEGGTRVPFAMQWPEKISGGIVYSNPVISLDIMATIAELAGASIDSEKALDGVNLIPFLTGEKKGKPHEYLFWRKWEQNAMAVRHQDKKIVAAKQWEKNGCELYSLKEDIEEANNIILKESLYSNKLIKQWENWNAQMKDRVFPTLGNDDWWER
ncbi:MAG: sulfatase-like hydrolase/transferase [Coraliomargaritaceae bacterium]|jgi:arylsulfatase A-like enzyme|tara:strand:- start:4827 stop:6221 length:1395 start_codon:yes stop_codon:yes gene_type:complete